jgi:hypothetical protein
MDYIDRKDQGKYGAKTSPTPLSMSPDVKIQQYSSEKQKTRSGHVTVLKSIHIHKLTYTEIKLYEYVIWNCGVHCENIRS